VLQYQESPALKYDIKARYYLKIVNNNKTLSSHEGIPRMQLQRSWDAKRERFQFLLFQDGGLRHLLHLEEKMNYQ
jgi:hypothetical protein